MKSLIEHMITEIILITIIFIFTAFTIVDMQTLAARRVHTAAIDQMQASYYSINEDDFNEKLHEKYPNWNITFTELNTLNTRKEYLITLDYEVVMPILNLKKHGTLEGYARWK